MKKKVKARPATTKPEPVSSDSARPGTSEFGSGGDRVDAAAADAALKDIEENGTIPWEDLKAKLGL